MSVDIAAAVELSELILREPARRKPSEARLAQAVLALVAAPLDTERLRRAVMTAASDTTDGWVDAVAAAYNASEPE